MLSKLLNGLPNELSSSKPAPSNESHSLIGIQKIPPSKFESLFNQLAPLDRHLRPPLDHQQTQDPEVNLLISIRLNAPVSTTTMGTQSVQRNAKTGHSIEVTDAAFRLLTDYDVDLQESSQSVFQTSAYMPIIHAERRPTQRPEDPSLSTGALSAVAVDLATTKVTLRPNTNSAVSGLTSDVHTTSNTLHLTTTWLANDTESWLSKHALFAVLIPQSHSIALTTTIPLSLENVDHAWGGLVSLSPSHYTPQLSPLTISSENRAQQANNQFLNHIAAPPVTVMHDSPSLDTRFHDDSILRTATSLQTTGERFQTPAQTDFMPSTDQDKELTNPGTYVASPTIVEIHTSPQVPQVLNLRALNDSSKDRPSDSSNITADLGSFHTPLKSATTLTATYSAILRADYSVVVNDIVQLVSTNEAQSAEELLGNDSVQQRYPVVYTTALPSEQGNNPPVGGQIDANLASALETLDGSGRLTDQALHKTQTGPISNLKKRPEPIASIAQNSKSSPNLSTASTDIYSFHRTTNFESSDKTVKSIPRQAAQDSAVQRAGYSAKANDIVQLVSASGIQPTDRTMSNSAWEQTHPATYVTALTPKPDGNMSLGPKTDAMRDFQFEELVDSGDRTELFNLLRNLQPSASVRSPLMPPISLPFGAKYPETIGTRLRSTSDYTVNSQPTVTHALEPAAVSHASLIRQSTSPQELFVPLTSTVHDLEIKSESISPIGQTTVSFADLTGLSAQVSDRSLNESPTDRFNSLWETLSEEFKNRVSEFRHSTSTTITLDLQTLGELRIELNVGKEFSQATFVADDLLLRQAIHEGLPKLKALLARAGFTRSDIHITDALNMMKGSQTQDSRSSVRSNEPVATENKASGLYELSRSFRVRAIKGLDQKNES